MGGVGGLSRREVVGLLAAAGAVVAVAGCSSGSDTAGGRRGTTTTTEDPRAELDRQIVELTAGISASLQITAPVLRRWAGAGNTWSTAYSPEAMPLAGTSGARPVNWDGPYLPTDTVFDIPNTGPPRLLYPERGGQLDAVPHLGPTLVLTPAHIREEFGTPTDVGNLTTLAVSQFIEVPLVDRPAGRVVVSFATIAPQFGEPVTFVGIVNIVDADDPRLSHARSQFVSSRPVVSHSDDRDEIDPAGSGQFEAVSRSELLTLLGETASKPVLIRVFDPAWYADQSNSAWGDGDVRIPGVPFITPRQWSAYQAMLDALLVQDAPAYSAAVDRAVEAGLAIGIRTQDVEARVREILGGLTDLDTAFVNLPLFQIGFTDLDSPLDFIR